MAGTSLDGVPHSFEFTQTGDEHVCIVRVTMPDNSVQCFDATCTTKRAARVMAVYKASIAIRCAKKGHNNASQEQEAPAVEQGSEVSRDTSPKSLDVESHDSEPHIEARNMIVHTPLDEYSSSAEEDDDDELRVGRRNSLRVPIAFVPAPDTPSKKLVDIEGDDNLRDFDEKPSVGRSSLGEAKSQHIYAVLDAAPLPERSRESSDVEGEIEPISKRLKENVSCPRFTSQKRKDSSPRLEYASGPEALSEPGEVAARFHRSTKHFRPDPSSPSSRRKQKVSVRKNGTLNTGTSNRSNLLSFAGNKNNKQEEHAAANEPRNYLPDDRQQRKQQKRELHNAELPFTSKPYNHNSRIPRVRRKKENATEVELDMTQPMKCEYAPTRHHQPPLPGPMPHPLQPGQIHNPPPVFAGHNVFPSVTPHPISYNSQYPVPHMMNHPPHMTAPYPPPVGPYGAHQTYLPQPSFPSSIMTPPIGAYPYPQSLPNGTAPFYQSHAQALYPGSQVQETQKAQREAEIRATAVEVAAQMAAEAAATDAARNARHDFEADQKAKLDGQGECGSTEGRGKAVRKGGESRPPNANQKAEKECELGSATAAEPTAQRHISGENEMKVSSLPKDDGDQEDYVSTLNEMAQKGQKCTNLSTPTYVTVRGENGSRCQQCTMSVRFVPNPEKEGILITKTVLASRKKMSKQLAAKEILAEMKKRLESYLQSSDEEVGLKENVVKTAPQKKSTGITTAVAALHRLYTLNALCGPPVFKPEEPAGDGDRGLWRSVVLLDVKDFGKHQYTEFGSSKKLAKQKCAFKAFEALKEMKVPGVECFTNITRDRKDSEKKKAPEGEDAAPIDAIVEMSEDEKGSDSSLDAELLESDNRLLLPKDYKLVFPKNESESELWFKENSKFGAHFGLFVDSPSARTVFTAATTTNLQERTIDIQTFQPRFLCMSTATSGIVISLPASARGADSDSADESNSRLSDVVVEILEDPKTKKHGFGTEDGMSVLEDQEDFRAEAVDDIAMISMAITGPETLRQSGPLPSLPELTRHWLRKEAGKLSAKGSWKENSNIPTELSEEGGKEIITGALASYACFCISQQMTQAARQKRTRAHGVAVAFLQLSEQVMSATPA